MSTSLRLAVRLRELLVPYLGDVLAGDVANNVAGGVTDDNEVEDVVARALRHRVANRRPSPVGKDAEWIKQWFESFPDLSERDINDIVIAVTIDEETQRLADEIAAEWRARKARAGT